MPSKAATKKRYKREKHFSASSSKRRRFTAIRLRTTFWLLGPKSNFKKPLYMLQPLMFTAPSIRRVIGIGLDCVIKREWLVCCPCLSHKQPNLLSLLRFYHASVQLRSYRTALPFVDAASPCSFVWNNKLDVFRSQNALRNWVCRSISSSSIELKTDGDVVRFSSTRHPHQNHSAMRATNTVKMSRKAKLNELRFYRLKAKKKMNSPNPEVRIRYKLHKAKRKEAWLIEKLRKFDVPKMQAETYDPEMLTEEEKHYLKRTGEKKKNFILVGRRGVFGGVVLNMHLHWKKHETVKVVCKPCKPGQIHEYAEELARLSKGIAIEVRPNSSIIFYRGKNYVQPTVMSPPDTLSKSKALEKYKYEQSLEHTSQFIEKLEKEVEEYLEHVARYKKRKEAVVES